MVVLEEEFQVRVWDGGGHRIGQGGTGRKNQGAGTDATSLTSGFRQDWRSNPSSVVT